MNDILTSLNNILKNVDVKQPLKTYFNPSFLFQQSYHNHEAVRLSVFIDTIDAKYGTVFPKLECNFDLTPYLVDRFIRKPKDLAKFVHKCLCETLYHEVSEALFFNNEHIVEPSHWGSNTNEHNT